jgi:hypothetical protein
MAAEYLTASRRERYDILDQDGMLLKKTERVRHGIKAAFMKRMAPEDPSRRQIGTLDCTVLF